MSGWNEERFDEGSTLGEVGGWNKELFEEGSTALGDEVRWVDGTRRGLKRAVHVLY